MSAPATPRRAPRVLETPPRHQRDAVDEWQEFDAELRRDVLKTTRLSMARRGLSDLTCAVLAYVQDAPMVVEPPVVVPQLPELPAFDLRPLRLFADYPPQPDFEADWEAVLHLLDPPNAEP